MKGAYSNKQINESALLLLAFSPILYAILDQYLEKDEEIDNNGRENKLHVFEILPKHKVEERGRELIMLAFSIFRLHSYWHFF